MTEYWVVVGVYAWKTQALFARACLSLPYNEVTGGRAQIEPGSLVVSVSFTSVTDVSALCSCLIIISPHVTGVLPV